MGVPSTDALEERISLFSGPRVLVVGDPVLDVYVYGLTDRVSREAPVVIVREDERESRLGGAANAAANLAALGAQVELVGMIGTDPAGQSLEQIAKARGIEIGGLTRSAHRSTVSKTRILAGGLHTRKQQMLRLDKEAGAPPSDDDRTALLASARAAVEDADAIILSEYTDGALTDGYLELARVAKNQGKFVVVDSRSQIRRYHGVTAVTPNEPEMEQAMQMRLTTTEDAVRAAEALREEIDADSVLLTRGKEGMAIARRDAPAALLAAHGSDVAVDVTGAGDTVTAAFTLALATGASTLEAAMLANCAASLAVAHTGAATVDPDELRREVRRLSPASLEVL